MQHELKWTTTDFALNRSAKPDEQQVQQLSALVQKLLSGTPLQYVFGSAHFMGHEYMVNSSVLIPRPETEELIRWVLECVTKEDLIVLDIGTGSGIIPIELALAHPSWNMNAMDVSPEALDVAQKNAELLHADVRFFLDDILNPSTNHLTYDVIISNPPYITKEEIGEMSNRVTDYEPHLALFTNGDPLQFYRAILEFASQNLSNTGEVFFECHEHYAHEVAHLFNSKFNSVEIRHDFQGKPRMVRAHQKSL